LDSIRDQASVKRMFSSISLRRGGTVSISTRKTFLIYIDRYCKFCGKTPDELIQDRMSDWKSDDIFVRRRHEEKLMEFAQHLRKEGYTSNTVSTAIGSIRSLYRTNYLPMTEVNIPSGRPVREYKVPTKEELSKAIGRSRMSWHKAFMVLSKDCGISLQDMLLLRASNESPTYGSIRKQLNQGQVPIHLRITREKTLYTYDSFLGLDSFNILNNEFIFPDMKSKFKTDANRKLFSYAHSSIQTAMRKIGQELGWKHFTPYSLRKFFRTRLTLAKVNDALLESWMGHSLGKVRGAYIAPPVEEQMEVYSQNYSALKL